MLLQSFQEVLDIQYKITPFDDLHKTLIDCSTEMLFLLKKYGYTKMERSKDSGRYILIWNKEFDIRDDDFHHTKRSLLINSMVVTPCEYSDEPGIKLKLVEDKD